MSNNTSGSAGNIGYKGGRRSSSLHFCCFFVSATVQSDGRKMYLPVTIPLCGCFEGAKGYDWVVGYLLSMCKVLDQPSTHAHARTHKYKSFQMLKTVKIISNGNVFSRLMLHAEGGSVIREQLVCGPII